MVQNIKEHIDKLIGDSNDSNSSQLDMINNMINSSANDDNVELNKELIDAKARLDELSQRAYSSTPQMDEDREILIKYNEAKDRLKNAQINYDKTENQYEKLLLGDNDLLLINIKKNLAKIKKSTDNEKVNHENVLENVNDLLNNYKAIITYNSKINDLLEIKKNENKNLENALEDMKYNKLTSDRRIDYEIIEKDSLKMYRKILFYLYFLLLVIWIIFSNFMPEKLYKNYTTWIYIIIYIAFPFTINYLVTFIYNLYSGIYYLINNMAPRNVYTNYYS
tara:strand:+ start:3108 stop:3944 length:837 start_codon:yes stop_codon:yes gene_type:complete